MSRFWNCLFDYIPITVFATFPNVHSLYLTNLNVKSLHLWHLTIVKIDHFKQWTHRNSTYAFSCGFWLDDLDLSQNKLNELMRMPWYHESCAHFDFIHWPNQWIGSENNWKIYRIAGIECGQQSNRRNSIIYIPKNGCTGESRFFIQSNQEIQWVHFLAILI